MDEQCVNKKEAQKKLKLDSRKSKTVLHIGVRSAYSCDSSARLRTKNPGALRGQIATAQ